MESPVVATHHSGIPDGMKPGVTGELVNERDYLALARELGSFLESSAKSLAFGQAARRFVVENFDMRDQVRGLEDLYTTLYARHASRSDDKN